MYETPTGTLMGRERVFNDFDILLWSVIRIRFNNVVYFARMLGIVQIGYM